MLCWLACMHVLIACMYYRPAAHFVLNAIQVEFVIFQIRECRKPKTQVFYAFSFYENPFVFFLQTLLAFHFVLFMMMTITTTMNHDDCINSIPLIIEGNGFVMF